VPRPPARVQSCRPLTNALRLGIANRSWRRRRRPDISRLDTFAPLSTYPQQAGLFAIGSGKVVSCLPRRSVVFAELRFLTNVPTRRGPTPTASRFSLVRDRTRSVAKATPLVVSGGGRRRGFEYAIRQPGFYGRLPAYRLGARMAASLPFREAPILSAGIGNMMWTNGETVAIRVYSSSSSTKPVDFNRRPTTLQSSLRLPGRASRSSTLRAGRELWLQTWSRSRTPGREEQRRIGAAVQRLCERSSDRGRYRPIVYIREGPRRPNCLP